MSERSDWEHQRPRLLLTLLAAVPIVLSLQHFFRWLAARPGTIPPEPLLDHLPAMDLSVLLFAVLYASVIASVVALLRHPPRLVRALQAYLILTLMRMSTMALFTLEPPPGMVSLQDPVIQFVYPGHEPFTKDLFFSGHVATATLLALAAPYRLLRAVLWVVVALVGLAVLVQHIHWTIDVAVAPGFAFLAWEFACITSRCRKAGGVASAA